MFVFPVSHGQERLWLHHQVSPEPALYNAQTDLRLRGPLDRAALITALELLVQRHDALRTTLALEDGALVQIVHPDATLHLEAADLSATPMAQREAAAAARAVAEARRPFDLAAGPLTRATLLRLSADDHLLLLTQHHTVTDRWSRELLLRELGSLYGDLHVGRVPALPPPTLHYPDFAVWERGPAHTAALERHLDWWQEHLAGAPAVLELPADHPRPPRQSFHGTSHYFTLPAALAEAITALARAEGATPFMVVLAAVAALAGRLAGGEELVLAVPEAGRGRREVEGTAGCFVNTLALRLALAGAPSGRELLRRAKAAALAAFEHADAPFDLVVERLRLPRDPARNPLAQVLVAYQSTAGPTPDFPGLAWSVSESDTGTAKFDVSFSVLATGGELACAIEYCTDLFTADTIQRWAGYLRRLLAGMTAEPDRPVAALPLLDGEERARLAIWGTGPHPDAPAACIHHLFEAHAAARPEQPALILGESMLTYG